MAGSVFSATMKGVAEFNKETKAIEGRVDNATLAALRANQNLLKRAVRKNLTGAPRWNHRGTNKITGKEVDIPGMPRHVARGGGPGRMTGVLYKGVGAVRRPKNANGTWTGGVGVGAKPNNVKKGKLEAKFPYFRPAVEASEPLMLKTYEKGWDKAVTKMGGIV